MLTLQVTLRAESDAGLLGGDWEYNPHIAHWSSFGRQRIAQHSAVLSSTTPVQVGPFHLPLAGSDLRGDESVWLKMLASTRHSGIDSIDTAEKGKVERLVQAGLARVPLVDALAAAYEKRTLEVAMEDPQLLMSEMNELRQREEKLDEKSVESIAVFTAYKGTLLVRPTLDATAGNPSALIGKINKAALTECASKLMYGSPRMLAAMQQMQGMLLTTYSNEFYGTPVTVLSACAHTLTRAVGKVKEDGSMGGPPTYPLGAEKSLEHMHLPLYYSEFGVLPPVALTQHRIDNRESGATSEERMQYGPARSSALMADKLLASSALRSGMTSDACVSAIRAQLTQSHTDEAIHPDYVNAEMVIADMGTSTANAILYMKDMRYPNKASVNLKKPAPVTAVKSTSTLKIALAVARSLNGTSPAHAQHRWYVAGAYGATTETTTQATMIEVEVESLDPVGLQGIAPSDDCEGSSVTGSDVLRNLARLATAVTREEAPFLHAAADVVRLRFVSDVVSSVSAAFVDTSGTELTREQTKAIKDLPLIGDDLDTRRKVGGHCHGLWLTRYTVAQGLEASGCVNLKRDLPDLARDYAAWEKRLPTYVLEGTASIDALVLPAGEVSQAIMGKNGGDASAFELHAATRKAFLTSLTAPTPLLDNTHAEGVSFYSHAQIINRRVSSFYMGVSHMLCPELYAMNPLFGQISPINNKSMTRGAEVGQLLRMPLGVRTEVAFVPTFGRLGRREWDASVRPVMAAIQNQMPLAATDYLPTPKTAELACMRVAHVVPPAVLTTLEKDSALPVGVALDRHALGVMHRLGDLQTKLIPHLAHCHGHPSRSQRVVLESEEKVTLPFYISSWKLAEKGAMEALVKQMQEYKQEGKITHFTFVSDRPLLNGSDVVTLVLTLPAAGV